MQSQVYEMNAVGEPFRRSVRELGPIPDDEVLVEVAGCGLCHTDLGFWHDGVRTRHALPLVLGHEISGVVVEAGADFEELVGLPVVVPAVIPCGRCEDCQAGRPMICRFQVMPGNDRDGGFASHVLVPGRGICPVPGALPDADAPLTPAGLTLRHLAVVADAVSTPYQAIVRSGLQAGELCVVVGLGGVGGYAAQIAKARGAFVVGIDLDPGKLQSPGVDLGLRPGDDTRALRKQLLGFAREVGAPVTRWTLLECSGSAGGQATAFGLLVHGATLCVVGFTMAKVTLRLSNLMAFDARAIGNWGCDPALYPEIVRLVLSGAIDLVGQTALRPLDEIDRAFADVHDHRVLRRQVLIPRASA